MNNSKRPSKNQILCRACGRPKMLFSTEAEAVRFMQYNGEIIRKESGFAPIRAYYCKFCGGWHITSKEKIYNMPHDAYVAESANHRKITARTCNQRDRLDEIEHCIELAKYYADRHDSKKARMHCDKAVKLLRHCKSVEFIPDRVLEVEDMLNECIEFTIHIQVAPKRRAS